MAEVCARVVAVSVRLATAAKHAQVSTVAIVGTRTSKCGPVQVSRRPLLQLGALQAMDSYTAWQMLL